MSAVNVFICVFQSPPAASACGNIARETPEVTPQQLRRDRPKIHDRLHDLRRPESVGPSRREDERTRVYFSTAVLPWVTPEPEPELEA